IFYCIVALQLDGQLRVAVLIEYADGCAIDETASWSICIRQFILDDGIVQGQNIGVCVIMDIFLRRFASLGVWGDTSITSRRPVASVIYLHTTYIKHLSARRIRQRRDGQQAQTEGQDEQDR